MKTTGQLLPIGKAYSGLTDVEIAELTEHFRRNAIVDRGRYLEVKPDTVLEIAFDSIQPSTPARERTGAAFPADQSDPARQDAGDDRYPGLRAASWRKETR